MNSYLPNAALFTGWDEQQARDYIKDKNYTRADVKLLRAEDGLIQVITVREIEWAPKKQP